MAPGKAGSTDLSISTFVEKESVAYNENHELLFLTSIKAPHIENEARDSRAPIDLVAVIDRSGSMRGAKLELVLQTMTFVVEQLKEADKLSIVAYDTTVDVFLALTNMDAAGKKLATQKLSKIKANAQTNLSGGLMTGIVQLINRIQKNPVASIMLFTDGCANCGLTTTSSIIHAINSNIMQIDTSCSIFTFGYGSDHDQEMLREISEAGKGNYYFIENLDDIPKCFGDCLGGLLSVAAQNMMLRLQGVGEVEIKSTISKVKDSENASGKSIELNLGDIYCEEERDILVVLSIPILENPDNEFFPAMEITVSYFNVITSLLDSKKSTLYLKRPLTTPPDQPVTLRIDMQRNRLTAASAMEQATQLGRSYRGQAHSILESAIAILRKSPSAGDPFTLALIGDVEGCMRELADQTVDYSAVQKKMSQKYQSHSRQRGYFDSGMYSNTSKTSLKSSFSSYSS
eukprot:Phypoly_transcript_07378.p1 GENE.Phypoly_transcript_07378~~Phypoly_transcript_07378.p1  ORF type:complete len:459 (+),score=39.52 Phypoly_transcript_07378:224-1600(+)